MKAIEDEYGSVCNVPLAFLQKSEWQRFSQQIASTVITLPSADIKI